MAPSEIPSESPTDAPSTTGELKISQAQNSRPVKNEKRMNWKVVFGIVFFLLVVALFLMIFL